MVSSKEVVRSKDKYEEEKTSIVNKYEERINKLKNGYNKLDSYTKELESTLKRVQCEEVCENCKKANTCEKKENFAASKEDLNDFLISYPMLKAKISCNEFESQNDDSDDTDDSDDDDADDNNSDDDDSDNSNDSDDDDADEVDNTDNTDDTDSSNDSDVDDSNDDDSDNTMSDIAERLAEKLEEYKAAEEDKEIIPSFDLDYEYTSAIQVLEYAKSLCAAWSWAYVKRRGYEPNVFASVSTIIKKVIGLNDNDFAFAKNSNNGLRVMITSTHKNKQMKASKYFSDSDRNADEFEAEMLGVKAFTNYSKEQSDSSDEHLFNKIRHATNVLSKYFDNVFVKW